ncbi:PLP-dependent transferase, partial [Escherichia coli]
MTRKQATIAVRSGLNDDEQYGCVVPPIHLSSTYNFTGFNEPRAHDYSRRGNPTRDVKSIASIRSFRTKARNHTEINQRMQTDPHSSTAMCILTHR